MFDQENAGSVSAFIIAQRRELIVIMIEVLRSQFILLFFDEGEDGNFDNNENKEFNNYRFASAIRFAKNVEFFNFDYVNIDNFAIVNVDRHIFYKNIYVFEDRLKNLTKDFIDEQRMRELISKCLRDEAFK